MSITTSYTKPALIGGAVIGALSALPIVNFCCCLWMLGGGVIAAYLLQDQEPAPITAGDGATIGVFAGLVGAVVQLVISIPFTLLMGPMRQQAIDEMVRNGRFPPEFERFASGFLFGAVGMIFVFVCMLIAGAIFSSLGGLLGAAIFRKKTQPGFIDVPPPPSYPTAAPPTP